MRPDESIASWCFRWLETLPEVKVILSGMSNMEQVEDNIKTFSGGAPLTSEECERLYEIAEGIKKSVPCTACGYCLEGCPAGLNIPELLSIYNDLSFSKSSNTAMRVEFLPDDKKPTACIGCGRCSEICPQKINIPKTLSTLAEMLETIPSWRQISRERELDAKKMREAKQALK
jgi:predicted aldo/keto reductase-like oxidoreductase